MRRPGGLIAIDILGAAILVLAVGWPIVALIEACVTGPDAPASGFSFSWRLAGLLGRTLLLAGLSASCSFLLSIPFAVTVARFRSNNWRWAAMGLCLTILLCSPMVFSFAWDDVVTRWFPPELPSEKIIISNDFTAPDTEADFSPFDYRAEARCIAIWSLWAWPIPAAMMTLGWSRRGRRAYEAARLEVSDIRAFCHAVGRGLMPWIVLGFLVVFVLLLNEYSVPHAGGLTVYATELLSWSAQSVEPLDTVWPAIPQVAITLLLIGLAMRLWWRISSEDHEALGGSPGGFSGAGATWLVAPAILLLVLSWPFPVAAMFYRLGSAETFFEAMRTYGGDSATTVACGLLAGLLSVAMGLGMCKRRWTRHISVVLLVVSGSFPGVLVGLSLIAAYNRAAFTVIYDHWPVLVLAYVARFGWVGLLAGLVVYRSQSRRLLEQAHLDGAGGWSVLASVIFPLHGPLLLCAALMVTALSVGDVAASALVRVPSFTPIAHIIIEKFHRFEDGMLVSLSMLVAASALPAALGIAWMATRRLARH